MCLHLQGLDPKDEVTVTLWNVGDFLPSDTASYPHQELVLQWSIIFQSVWPQLESEILKAKFIFRKQHNFELNVAYMNCEGRIWIEILFWVIWLLAGINKICTREIKFKSQDLISYMTEVIIHINILYIIICMTSQLSSLQGGFLHEYFTVWKSYEVMAYIFYIYCDLHISH